MEILFKKFSYRNLVPKILETFFFLEDF